jgi:tripartite ATP-independent transporter DctM subunit
MDETIVGILILFVLLGVFLTGFEMAFAMGLVGFVGYAMLISFAGAADIVGKVFFESLSSYGLTVIPLFVLMGQVAFNAGIAKGLYDSAHKFMGHVPGGLAIATVAGAAAFKAICGSVAATVATFASVAVPEMDRYGYSKKLSTGVVAIVGTLGGLIPPSVILIILGLVTQQSIGKLFLAGLIPGLIVAVFFVGIIIGWCRINPSLGPKSEKYPMKEKINSLYGVIWPIVIFFVIIGGFMAGVFTPTEAGSIGAFAVIVFTLLKKDLNFEKFKKSIAESLLTACMVLMLVAGSAILGAFITVTNIPILAADWTVQLPLHRHLIMILICLIYLLGGSFIDDLAFMILATPIFFPVIIKLGYDPMWAAIMISVTVMIGGVIPPVAMCVFIVKNITKVPIGTIYSGVYPFLIALFLIATLLFMFPQIATFLPNLFMK